MAPRTPDPTAAGVEVTAEFGATAAATEGAREGGRSSNGGFNATDRAAHSPNPADGTEADEEGDVQLPRDAAAPRE